MRWEPGQESDDIVDRRGEGPSGGGGGGGNGGLGLLLWLVPWLLRSTLGRIVLLVVVLVMLGNAVWNALSPSVDPTSGALHGGTASSTNTRGAAGDKQVQFVSFVLDDVQKTWDRELPQQHRGTNYHHAKLVLFTEETPTACGEGVAAAGPFYCPGDEQVYLDLAFFRELADRFKAKGDFAQAYVVAHEIGHHVQNILGTSARVSRAPRSQQNGATGLSVRLELQADCYAGVWAHSTEQRNILEAGDIDQALGAAAAVGDDRLQREATGRVHPETWTHGSSDERSRWFKKGFTSGTIDACDAFAAPSL